MRNRTHRPRRTPRRGAVAAALATLALTLIALLAGSGSAHAAADVTLHLSPGRGVVGSTIHVSGTCPVHAVVVVNVGIGPRHSFGNRSGILSADGYRLSATGRFAGPLIIRRDPESEVSRRHPRAGDVLWVRLTCLKRGSSDPAATFGDAFVSLEVARAGGGTLPVTGTPATLPDGGLGAGLVVAGGALIWLGRRRYLATHRA